MGIIKTFREVGGALKSAYRMFENFCFLSLGGFFVYTSSYVLLVTKKEDSITYIMFLLGFLLMGAFLLCVPIRRTIKWYKAIQAVKGTNLSFIHKWRAYRADKEKMEEMKREEKRLIKAKDREKVKRILSYAFDNYNMHFLKQELDKKGFSEEEKEIFANRIAGYAMFFTIFMGCFAICIAIFNNPVYMFSAMAIAAFALCVLTKWHTWRKYGASIEIEKSKLKKAEE